MITSLRSQALPERGRPQLRLVGATTSPIPNQSADRRFSVRDRIAVEGWMLQPSVHGYGKTVFDHASGVSDEEQGEYLLIYSRADGWARWGIGCRADGYLLWDALRGPTIAVFDDIRMALAELVRLSA